MPNDAGTLNRKESERSMKDYCASRERAMKEVWNTPMRESHDDMEMPKKMMNGKMMKKGKKK